ACSTVFEMPSITVAGLVDRAKISALMTAHPLSNAVDQDELIGNYIVDSLLSSKGGVVSDFGEVTHPVGRKEHRCEWCYGPIPKGEKHARFVGKWQGEFQDWRMHNECLDASEDTRDDGFEPG